MCFTGMQDEDKWTWYKSLARGRHQPKKEGGLPLVYLCPDLLAPFFYQVIVPKMAICYSNFTVIVCFFSHFCHNHHHQNYHNYHHNYYCNHHCHHQFFSVMSSFPQFRWFGQCPKEKCFFQLMSSLNRERTFSTSFEFNVEKELFVLSSCLIVLPLTKKDCKTFSVLKRV